MPLADADGPTGLMEIGWHLHPRHQGQGYATEAAEAVLAAAAAAGIGEVLALTDLDNVRSQAVTARLGMRDEGTTDRWFGLTARQFRKTIALRRAVGPQRSRGGGLSRPGCSPRLCLYRGPSRSRALPVALSRAVPGLTRPWPCPGLVTA